MYFKYLSLSRVQHLHWICTQKMGNDLKKPVDAVNEFISQKKQDFLNLRRPAAHREAEKENIDHTKCAGSSKSNGVCYILNCANVLCRYWFFHNFVWLPSSTYCLIRKFQRIIEYSSMNSFALLFLLIFLYSLLISQGYFSTNLVSCCIFSFSLYLDFYLFALLKIYRRYAEQIHKISSSILLHSFTSWLFCNPCFYTISHYNFVPNRNISRLGFLHTISQRFQNTKLRATTTVATLERGRKKSIASCAALELFQTPRKIYLPTGLYLFSPVGFS